MIAKRRTFPLRILIDEALLRRLPQNHPKRQEILRDLLIRRAGLRGEKEIDYYLSLLNENDFYILQDLRLPLGANHFQMDFLLLSPQFALIIENKHMPGIIEFDSDFSQVLRRHNDKTEVYDDPIVQVNRQLNQLQTWLKLHRIPLLPFEFLVTYSHPGSILQNPSKNPEIYNRICRSTKLVMKINEYQTRHQKEFLTAKDLKKMIKLLIKSHEPEGSHLHKFNLSPSDILPGILCPSCQKYHMERISKVWHCHYCGAISTDAHEQAIQDYFLLISQTITNKQLRQFLLLPSQKIASNLLVSSGLEYAGCTKNRVYFHGKP